MTHNQPDWLRIDLRAVISRAIGCVCLLAIGMMWYWARSDDPQTALLASSQDGDVCGIDRALARGAAIDRRDACGLTPLIVAARANRVPAVQCLLRHGASVNARSDIYGTALTVASQND